MNVDPLLSTSNSSTDVILSDESANVMYEGSECFITLSSNRFTVEGKKNKRIYVKMVDVVGAAPRVMREKADGKILDVHCYGLEESGYCCCSSVMRKSKTLTLSFKDESDCISWCNAINCVSRGLSVLKDDLSNIQPPPSRNYLVFVNPVGGTGNALRIWERHTLPFLINAGVNYELVVTERANHAKDIMSTTDLTTVDAVVIVGGDGLIFEVVSGLMSRDDREQIMKTLKLAPIPGGSGNGLIKSILFECGEDYSPQNAAFLAVKGTAAPLDLSHVNTLHESHVSFLILGWGLISDVDILSEPYRWMGETRFDVYAVYRLLLKKLYRGRLSLYVENQDSAENRPPPTSREPISLPPIDQPLDTTSDSNWKVIEDDFVLVWILQTTHCSASMYSGPGASINDGLFTVIVVRDTGRCRLLSFLLGIESGGHMKDPSLEVYKATAYRLEPLTDEGLYTLDGEVVEYGPIQGVMQPAALQVLKTPARS